MELYQIRYFVALCETLNFARAAERCGVSSPSLTRAVQKLEPASACECHALVNPPLIQRTRAMKPPAISQAAVMGTNANMAQLPQVGLISRDAA